MGLSMKLVLLLLISRSDVIFIDWERPIRKGGGGVSMWRTVLIANEWNRMQTRRKNSVEFSLILVGFFMYGLDQYNNASPQPNFDNAHHGHTNVALQFANNVMFWGMASLSQYVWRFLLYERYITEPPSTKFIDLCTVCNISCFVLMDHCKSYYLHCRSPYQSAECAMDELLEQLTKEANGFAIDRGLDGASKGCQVFDLFTSSMFRRQISKVKLLS